MLSTVYGTIFFFFFILNALYNVVCNCFNLDQSKILSSGNGFSCTELFFNRPLCGCIKYKRDCNVNKNISAAKYGLPRTGEM